MEAFWPHFEAAMAEIEAEKGVGYEYSGDEAELVQRIKDLLDTYVKPAVEMDGGNIEFKSFITYGKFV